MTPRDHAGKRYLESEPPSWKEWLWFAAAVAVMLWEVWAFWPGGGA